MYMQNVIEELELLKLKCGFIGALETGTIRNVDEEHNSTLHISKVLGGKGSLISVDISPEAIAISKKICSSMGNVWWIQSDSIKALKNYQKRQKKFDFILLDSVNDPDHLLKEFVLAEKLIEPGGVIVVDDSGIKLEGGFDKTTNAKKGHAIWNYLIAEGVEFKLKPAKSSRYHSTQLIVRF